MNDAIKPGDKVFLTGPYPIRQDLTFKVVTVPNPKNDDFYWILTDNNGKLNYVPTSFIVTQA